MQAPLLSMRASQPRLIPSIFFKLTISSWNLQASTDAPGGLKPVRDNARAETAAHVRLISFCSL